MVVVAVALHLRFGVGLWGFLRGLLNLCGGWPIGRSDSGELKKLFLVAPGAAFSRSCSKTPFCAGFGGISSGTQDLL